MKVSIGFSTSSWWVSRAIRWFTRAPVSHTYIVFDDTGSSFGHEVYEAAWCGFRMSTRPKLASGTTVIVREVPVSLDPGAALSICRSWLETPYAYPALLGEAWVQVGRWLGKRWENPFPSPHAMFCSEAATYLLQQAKPERTLARKVVFLDPRTTDPYQLEEVLSA